MGTDEGTKILLMLIALGLFLNAAVQLWRPVIAAAQQGQTCTGDLKSSQYGGGVNGYSIKLDCR